MKPLLAVLTLPVYNLIDALVSRATSAALLARVAAERGRMGGKPIIRGRRVTPSMVLNMLANGVSRNDVMQAYPVLEPEDIDACLLYAARLSDLAAAEGLTVAAETALILGVLTSNHVALNAGAFLRAAPGSIRKAKN